MKKEFLKYLQDKAFNISESNYGSFVSIERERLVACLEYLAGLERTIEHIHVVTEEDK